MIVSVFSTKKFQNFWNFKKLAVTYSLQTVLTKQFDVLNVFPLGTCQLKLEISNKEF